MASAERVGAESMPAGPPGVPGHRVLPDAGRGAAVLVLCGAGAPALAVEACRRLARHGFVAFAPELPEAGGDGVAEAEREAVDAAVHALFCDHATDGARIGVLGFGRGGRLALDAAGRNAGIGAAVSCGGAPASGPRDASTGAPVLAVFAERDEAVASGAAEALEGRLRRGSDACALRIEPGVAPEYLDPARPDHYDAVAARASWDAVLAHFRAELRWRPTPPSDPPR